MNNYTVFDAHCDTLCQILDKGADISHNTYNIDKKRMMEYDGYTQVFACFIAPEYYNDPKARFDALYKTYLAQDFSGINPILSLEGGEVITSLEDIDYLYSCGVRAVALTWNNTNMLASGVMCEDTGLTPFGKSAVRRMEDLGILVDVSHLSDKSFYDVASIATRPIIATHSNSRVICPHPRNLTDDMFKIICESGGCVGINLYPVFISEKERCDENDILLHIEHFIELGGMDSIGIGADFDGTDNNLPVGISGCEGLYKVFDKMRSVGLSDDEIDKISHKNFERIFGEVL